jgi:hypothetical protein
MIRNSAIRDLTCINYCFAEQQANGIGFRWRGWYLLIKAFFASTKRFSLIVTFCKHLAKAFKKRKKITHTEKYDFTHGYKKKNQIRIYSTVTDFARLRG